MTIKEFDQMLIDLAKDVSNSTGIAIDRRSVFYALFILLADKEDLEWSAELWDIHIDYNLARELLTGFDFNVLNQNIDMEQSWFPRELFPEQKVRVKEQNSIWVVHKNDVDPFPSNPHAHCLEWNYKLHLGNGQCFRKRQLVHNLNRKYLLKVREKVSKVFKGDLPPMESC